MKKPILVILAAGMGSRYGGLKQVDPIGPSGEAIIDYSIFDAKRAGFETVVFIIKEAIADEFKSRIGDKIAEHMEVRYAYQELDKIPEGFSIPEGREKPWGTGHALICAKDVIDAPFVVINADDFYGRTAYEEIYNYLTSEDTYIDGKLNLSMVGFKLENTVSENGYVSRGVCKTTEDGYLDSIVEYTHIQSFPEGIKYSFDSGENWDDIAANTIVSMNIWGFQKESLVEFEESFKNFLSNSIDKNPQKAEFYIPTTIEELIKSDKAKVKVLESANKWFGVTYKEDKPDVVASVNALIEAGEYPDNLWN